MEKGMIGVFFFLKKKKKEIFKEVCYLPTCGARTCTFVLHSGGSNPGMSVMCLSCQAALPLGLFGARSLDQVLGSAQPNYGCISLKHWKTLLPAVTQVADRLFGLNVTRFLSHSRFRCQMDSAFMTGSFYLAFPKIPALCANAGAGETPKLCRLCCITQLG